MGQPSGHDVLSRRQAGVYVECVLQKGWRVGGALSFHFTALCTS